MTPSAEKPLHVRVAEALGWTEARCRGNRLSWEAKTPLEGPGPHFRCEDMHEPIPRYDTDWSATGPLIEKYGLSVSPMGKEWRAELDVPNGYAVTDLQPLPAVCRLIVALKEAGKL